MIELSFEEAGDITLREAGFAEYAAWFDTIAAGKAADASQNLAIDCAAKPDAAGLAALFEDFGGLPETLASAIIERVGTPAGGAEDGYPCVRLGKARANHSAHQEALKLLAEGERLLASTPDGPEKDAAAIKRVRLQREVESLAAALIPLDLLDTCERVSRRALFFRTPGGLLAFRPPPRAAVADYVDALAAAKANKPDASYLGAGRTLMLACAISPDAGALAAMIETYPALAQWIPPVLHEASLGGKARPRS